MATDHITLTDLSSETAFIPFSRSMALRVFFSRLPSETKLFKCLINFVKNFHTEVGEHVLIQNFTLYVDPHLFLEGKSRA
jgi:hypothetical protein